MKTNYIIKGLVQNEVVYFIDVNNQSLWNSDFEVRRCTTTIDEATLFDSYDEAFDTILDYKLQNFEVYPVCPICGEDYADHPAISRKDNKSEICPNCGIGEAFMDFIEHQKKATI